MSIRAESHLLEVIVVEQTFNVPCVSFHHAVVDDRRNFEGFREGKTTRLEKCDLDVLQTALVASNDTFDGLSSASKDVVLRIARTASRR